MRRFFVPSYTGDFRLSQSDVDTCALEVVDPTPVEIAQLRAFLSELRKKEKVDPLAGVTLAGTSVVEIALPIHEAGAILLGHAAKRGALTAVASKDGQVVGVYTSHDGEEAPAPPADTPAESDGATVRRPNLAAPSRGDCPDSRASEVLRAFCTERQWTDWMRTGAMVVYGGTTGHAYRLAHRKQDIARRQGRVAFDLDDGIPIHAYDWMVPPPEEVLGLKLYLEHAEAWVRNRAAVDDWRARDVLAHPMGPDFETVDGMTDAGLLS